VGTRVKDAANRQPHYPEYETDSAHVFLIHCFPRVKLRRFPVRRCRYEIVNVCSKLEQWYCRIDVHQLPIAVTSYSWGGTRLWKLPPAYDHEVNPRDYVVHVYGDTAVLNCRFPSCFSRN
jgi:hypothetical protein